MGPMQPGWDRCLPWALGTSVSLTALLVIGALLLAVTIVERRRK